MRRVSSHSENARALITTLVQGGLAISISIFNYKSRFTTNFFVTYISNDQNELRNYD